MTREGGGGNAILLGHIGGSRTESEEQRARVSSEFRLFSSPDLTCNDLQSLKSGQSHVERSFCVFWQVTCSTRRAEMGQVEG